MKNSFVSAAFGAVFVLSSHAVHAELAYGITSVGNIDGERLLRFDTAAPGAGVNVGTFSGLPSSLAIRAIDFRPADGRLYALAVGQQGAYGLYTVNLQTAQLSLVGAGTVASLAWPFRVSMDFDPVSDTLRVVTGDVSRNNLRFSPLNGGLLAEDSNLAYAAGDVFFQANPLMQDIAYSRVVNGLTTLFGSDFNTGSLTRIGGVNGSPSPDTGEMNTIGRHALPFLTNSAAAGFDISHTTGVAYMSHDVFDETSAGWNLSTINLATGVATPVGAFGVNVLDMSVVIPSPSALATLALAAGLSTRRRR